MDTRKRKTVEYTYPEGSIRGRKQVTVFAFETATPGLLVTPYDPLADPQPKPQAYSWTITHRHTGKKVLPPGTYLSRRVALLAAGALGGAFDWDRPLDGLSGVTAAKDALVSAGLFTWMRHELHM